ncbi:MAG: hypothetical protein IPK82_04405 [Polyangiaceae bacterium]|nr:hypothetical protein [Polyangiaceae bacterium]
MRCVAAISIAAWSIVMAATGVAHGDDPQKTESEKAPTTGQAAGVHNAHSPGNGGFSDSLVFDNGRRAVPPPDPEKLSFSIRGEYQLRYRAASDLSLSPPLSARSETKLGQNHYLYHWLRITPRLQYRDNLALVAQIDVPRGMIAGDTTRNVDQVRDSWSKPNWIEVHPRQLYLEYTSPIGLFRVGQQTSHWGMGMLANDGDHPSIFGDYQRGALVERILYAVPPLGKGTPLLVAVGGDLVFEDNTADLLGDDIVDHPRPSDLAFQGVGAVTYRAPSWELGVYGVYRHQTRENEPTASFRGFTEKLEVGVVDVTAKMFHSLPSGSAYIYGQMEAAMIFGSSSYLRGAYRNDIRPLDTVTPEKVQSYGAVARIGVVREAREGKTRWGDFVAELEWGYASGDANPNDGITKRFTMDPNHNVGLILFDQVLAWKTARAATIAQDPNIVNRPPPGLDFLPSRGGVFGATYLNPRVIVRPRPWVDLRGGVVIAQSTADFVDPYHAGALGDFSNYDGGNSRRHDLGVELDLGFLTRIAFRQGTTIELGAEGGAFFPGHAFDNARGRTLANQYLANMKLGVLY